MYRKSHFAKVPKERSPLRPRTLGAAVGATVPDELPGSQRDSSLVAENHFKVSGDEDNCVGYLLAFFEDHLPRRAVDPPGKTD